LIYYTSTSGFVYNDGQLLVHVPAWVHLAQAGCMLHGAPASAQQLASLQVACMAGWTMQL